MSDEIKIEEQEDAGDEKPKRKEKYDSIAQSYYGKEFTHYMKVGEVADLIPAFKERYYEAKLENFNVTLTEILRPFLADVRAKGRDFTPYPTQIRAWRKKWDKDILAKRGMELEVTPRKLVGQAIRTRNDRGMVVVGAPQDDELEAGMRTLGGELMNDAFQMLQDDQELEETFTSDQLMKRRAYIVNVFSHVTKMVQGKAALALKKSSSQREDANFLMGLLAQATSGAMTPEQLEALRTVYSKPPVPTVVVEEPAVIIEQQDESA